MKFNVNREQMENILKLHETYIIDELSLVGGLDKEYVASIVHTATDRMWEDFDEEDRQYIAKVALGSAGYVED